MGLKAWHGDQNSSQVRPCLHVDTPPQKAKVFIQAWIKRDSVLCCHFPLNIDVL